MDSAGWVKLDEFVEQIKTQKWYETCTLKDVEKVVLDDSKNRYDIKNGKIRANQGHTFKVDLGFKVRIPPIVLYHGTAEKFVSQIRKKGLLPMGRHHVHLSFDKETAINVGKRRGKPFIFEIDTKKMVSDGIKFYQSKNGVWLTDKVESKYFKN